MYIFCAHRWPTYCIMARFIPCAYILLSTCSTFIGRKSRAEGVDSRVYLFSYTVDSAAVPGTPDQLEPPRFFRESLLLGLLNYSLEGSDAAFPCKKIANAPL